MYKIINVIYHDRIDVFEWIDVNKTRISKECDICHYWYFLDKGFKFQSDVCNWCHDVVMMSMNFSHTGILNTHGDDYHCEISEIFSGISKSGAIK